MCKTCGEEHEDIPFSFASDFPDPYANMSADERELRATIGSDQCIIDEKEFYLRGCLEIPIRYSGEIFLWGLWASMHEEDFDEVADSWEEEGRETRRGPYKGRLVNKIGVYEPSTFNLKVTIQVRPVGARPLFFVDEPNHPLAIVQKNGMTRDEACELSARIMHGH